MTSTNPAQAEAKESPAAARSPGMVLAVLAGAQFLVALDITIILIAVPSIERDLNFSPAALQWVVNAYTLTFGGLLLLGGRLGDLFGKRRIFLTGTAVFVVASLFGGLAQDQASLIASRAGQGVGAALLSPTAFALVATHFSEGPRRNRAFGVMSATAGGASALGVIAGGVLTDALTWRSAFFVNVPLGALIFAGAALLLSEPARPRRKLDLLGAVTVTGGSTALVNGAISASGSGWTSGPTLISFGAALVLLVGFVVVQATHSQPLVSLKLFVNRARSGAFGVQLLNNCVNIGFYYFLSKFAQDVFHYDPLTAGFALLPAPVCVMLAAQIASRLLARTGPLPILIAGALLLISGLFYASFLSYDSDYLTRMLPALILYASGFGSMVVPVTITALSGIQPQDSGMATGVLNACQQVGTSFGLAAMVTVFASGLHDSPGKPSPGVVTAAYDNALTLGAGIGVLSLLVVLLTIRQQRARTS
ncbi:MFS transporter [Streptomyces albidus (ex Kaewkla and Franco 2022)]|uniref:MFS transporter n=1 Tax=Streptomyces albidus (ex Kaewkla and Franco 2022) TaxID=722709 RepID=UPI0015EE7888|nr:MFS transporter [Streptomyces albidus (ex Kaewkla and Franco 2022)]